METLKLYESATCGVIRIKDPDSNQTKVYLVYDKVHFDENGHNVYVRESIFECVDLVTDLEKGYELEVRK